MVVVTEAAVGWAVGEGSHVPMLHSSKSTLIYVNTGYGVTVVDRLEASVGGLDAEAGRCGC